MGRLIDFIDYLDDRAALMTQIEHRLCQLQQRYESFFAELVQQRESELGQLGELIVAHRRRQRGHPAAGSAEPLPAALDQALTAAEAQVNQEFDEKLQRLREACEALWERAEETRRQSATAEARTRDKNVTLDAAEEQLKQRSAVLADQVTDYNRRIRDLGHGWGFFANLFRMRRLAAERRVLDQEQADLAARIETLRARWSSEEVEFTAAEQKLQQSWVELKAQAAALQAQIAALEQARPRIVLRSTTERVLFEQVAAPPAAAADDPPCPRCEVPNPAGNCFCRVCARRLRPDRPDLAGSIAEIGEINHHHARFADGIRACQQIIGLVRGIVSGLQAFRLSVADVLSSERRYPLPPLRIEVPPASVAYARNFDAFDQSLRGDNTLHPALFAQQVQPLIDEVFSESKIKAFFEAMGDELSRQASSQW